MKEQVINIAKNLSKSLIEIKFMKPAQIIQNYVNGDKFRSYPFDKQCSGLLRLINTFRGDFQGIESEKPDDITRIQEAISLLKQFKDSLQSLIDIESKKNSFNDAYANFKAHYPVNKSKNESLASQYYTILNTALDSKYTIEQKCLNFSILLNLDDDVAAKITPMLGDCYAILQFFITSLKQNISERMALYGLLLLKQLKSHLSADEDNQYLNDNIAGLERLDPQLNQALRPLHLAANITPDLIRSTCGLVIEKKADFSIPIKTHIFEFDQKKLPSGSISGNYTQIRMQILTQSFMTLLENQNLPSVLANIILQYFIPEDRENLKEILNVYGDEIDIALYSSDRFNFTFFIPNPPPSGPKLELQIPQAEKEKCSLM